MTEQIIYVGKLRDGTPLVNLSGDFEKEDYNQVSKFVRELVDSGNQSIVVDCCGTRGVPKAWVRNLLQQLESELEATLLVRSEFCAVPQAAPAIPKPRRKAPSSQKNITIAVSPA